MSTVLQEQLVADRAALRQLLQAEPDCPMTRLCAKTHHCESWIRVWKKRLAKAASQDEAVLWGKSHTPHKTPKKPPELLVKRLIELRNQPPSELKRIPGPKTLAYYLAQDDELKAAGIIPPRSTSTIYKLMVRQGCYDRPALKKATPTEQPAPLECIAMDFKDSLTVEIEPGGKKQHLVEILNFVDEGTSVLWEAVAREDFTAQTVVETLLEVFEQNGLPHSLRFDRDPRFVGARQGRDFPSALVRMLHVLGIVPLICPPRQPQKNGFVERYNRTLKFECLLVSRPENLARVREVIGPFKEFYNRQRPHQGKSCQNRPPRVAFPELPALPTLPVMLDPDSWLSGIDQEHFTRKVRQDGSVVLDKYAYYLSREWVGQYVRLKVEALKREVVVFYQKREIKRFRLKGLYRRALSMEQYREAIIAEAKAEQRGWRPLIESSTLETATVTAEGEAAASPVEPSASQAT